jgi:hypothetical protein
MQALDAAPDVPLANATLDASQPQSPFGAALVSAEPAGAAVSSVARQSLHQADPAPVPEKAAAADSPTAPPRDAGIQAAPMSEASRARPVPPTESPVPVADQITPSVVSMVQGHGTGGRLTISITPDQLGQVHIMVERATDGTTSIHVAAEHLATLELLRQDRGDLTRALDQAGLGSEGHSLSFSWDGSGGGMPGWGNSSHQPGDRSTADVIRPYVEETVSAPSAAAAARGGIDVTA